MLSGATFLSLTTMIADWDTDRLFYFLNRLLKAQISDAVGEATSLLSVQEQRDHRDHPRHVRHLVSGLHADPA